MRWVAVMSHVLAVSGCATVEPPAHMEDAPAPVVVSGVAQDEQGVFVFCGEDCPQPTPKQIAVALPAIRLDAPSPPPPPPKVEAKPITLHVQFALASAVLNKAEKAKLYDAKQDLLHADKIRITGMTDAIGTKRFNRRLALKRAQTIKRHLMVMGVPSQRIEVGMDCCAGNPPEVNPPYRKALIEILASGT